MNHHTELAALLAALVRLDVPKVPETPEWDPPATIGLRYHDDQPDPQEWEAHFPGSGKRDTAENEAAFYRERYHEALTAQSQWVSFANELYDKHINPGVDHNVESCLENVAELCRRAERVRNDLEREGLPLPLPLNWSDRQRGF